MPLSSRGCWIICCSFAPFCIATLERLEGLISVLSAWELMCNDYFISENNSITTIKKYFAAWCRHKMELRLQGKAIRRLPEFFLIDINNKLIFLLASPRQKRDDDRTQHIRINIELEAVRAMIRRKSKWTRLQQSKLCSLREINSELLFAALSVRNGKTNYKGLPKTFDGSWKIISKLA